MGRKLRFRDYLVMMIVAHVEWRVVTPVVENTPQTTTHPAGVPQSNTPHFLGQLDLEITLTSRYPGAVTSSGLNINQMHIADHGFRPRPFVVRIEQGIFIEPAEVGMPQRQDDRTPRFALRLLSDQSPYPSKYDWRERFRIKADGISTPPWEVREFVGQKLPDTGAHTIRAMNDVSEADTLSRMRIQRMHSFSNGSG